MILEIVVSCVVIVFVICSYIIFNLYNKVDNLEQWIDSTYIRVPDVWQEMRKIHPTGHFEADDEVGSIFQGIKSIITELNDSIEEEI